MFLPFLSFLPVFFLYPQEAAKKKKLEEKEAAKNAIPDKWSVKIGERWIAINRLYGADKDSFWDTDLENLHFSTGTHGRILDTNIHSKIREIEDRRYRFDFLGFSECDNHAHKDLMLKWVAYLKY